MFSLATLFTSKTRYEVLGLFLSSPNMELGVRETARKLDMNVMLVRNELNLLQDSGILKSRKVANSIQFSLNTDCPAVEPLRTLYEISLPGDSARHEAEITDKAKVQKVVYEQ